MAKRTNPKDIIQQQLLTILTLLPAATATGTFLVLPLMTRLLLLLVLLNIQQQQHQLSYKWPYQQIVYNARIMTNHPHSRPSANVTHVKMPLPWSERVNNKGNNIIIIIMAIIIKIIMIMTMLLRCRRVREESSGSGGDGVSDM